VGITLLESHSQGLSGGTPVPHEKKAADTTKSPARSFLCVIQTETQSSSRRAKKGVSVKDILQKKASSEKREYTSGTTRLNYNPFQVPREAPDEKEELERTRPTGLLKYLRGAEIRKDEHR